MDEPELQRITLDNCEVMYKFEDGKVVLFGYTGQTHDVITALMERYLLPRKRFLEHPYHPNAHWWGNSAP